MLGCAADGRVFPNIPHTSSPATHSLEPPIPLLQPPSALPHPSRGWREEGVKGRVPTRRCPFSFYLSELIFSVLAVVGCPCLAPQPSLSPAQPREQAVLEGHHRESPSPRNWAQKQRFSIKIGVSR